MKYVNFTPIIDVSSVIWDVNDFKADKQKYYDLKAKVTSLFGLLENQELKFLLRNELINEIKGGFPINSVSGDFYEFYGLIQSFFSRIDLIQYPNSTSLAVRSTPDLTRGYFTDSTNDEIQHLITRIHNGKETNKIYFTFKVLWDKAYGKLITLEIGINEIRHDRIISDDFADLQKSLEKFELKFGHNPKHNSASGYYKDGGELVSPLSCYDIRTGDPSKAQELLNNAIKHDEYYFNFDEEYEVYVRFIKTKDNIYHAHDVSDICDVSPGKVAVTFNKNKIPEKIIPEKIISKFGRSVTRGKGIDDYGKWIGT
jgi:hypothetical protein